MAVDGTWNVSVQSPMGEQKATLTLKADEQTAFATAALALGAFVLGWLPPT